MKKIIEAGTCLLIFLLPWQTRWIFEFGKINGGVSEYLTLSLYLTDFLMIVLLIAVFLFYQKELFAKKSILSTYRFMVAKGLALFLFVGIFFVSIFLSEKSWLAIQRFNWMVLAILLAWLVFKIKNRTKIAYCFISGLLFSAGLGIWQFFAQYAFANKWLGLASHDVRDPGTAYLEIIDKEMRLFRWLRSYGSFDHPNVFGFMMMLGILFTIWLIYQDDLKKHGKSLLYFYMSIFSFGLFASLSRSALLGLFFGFGIVLLRTKFSKKVQKPIMFACFILILLTLVYPGTIFSRSKIDTRLEQKSINEREIYFKQSIEIIRKHVFFGVGAGNYVVELQKSDTQKPFWAYQSVHNYFLLVWAELGIFAMLILLIMFGLMTIYFWKKSVFQLAILLSFFPALMLDHWLWDLHFGWLLIGFVVGFLLIEEKQ